MEKNHNISDELLTRYLSGKVSKEEEELVLTYMAENDEHVEDLLNITTGIELQKRAQKIQRQHKIKPIYWWSAVAVIVLAVGSVWMFTNRSTGVQMESAPMYATSDTVSEQDTICEDFIESRNLNIVE